MSVVAATAIVVVAAAVQGSVGIGYSLLAAPLLALVQTAFVPGPVLCGLVALGLLMLVDERAAADRDALTWALLGRIPGTALGAMALTRFNSTSVSVLVGAVIVVAVAVSMTRWQPRLVPRNLFVAGLVSGAMETTSAVGGPPLALIYRAQPEAMIRATMAVFFVFGGTLSIAALRLAGHFDSGDLKYAAVVVPGTVAGFVLARSLRRSLSTDAVRAAIIVISGMAGTLVLLRGAL